MITHLYLAGRPYMSSINNMSILDYAITINIDLAAQHIKTEKKPLSALATKWVDGRS